MDNKLNRQSRSDDSNGQQRSKGNSNSRPANGVLVTQPQTAQKTQITRATDHSNERKRKFSANKDNTSAHGNSGPGSISAQQRRGDIHSVESTPNESAGNFPDNNIAANGGSSDTGFPSAVNVVHTSQSTVGGQNSVYIHKSDTNINSGGNTVYGNGPNGHQRNPGTSGTRKGHHAEAKKKRKNSDKAQRRTSNNRKNTDKDQNSGGMFPPADGVGSGGSHPRSHSRGTVSQHSQGGQQNQKDQMMPQQQYYDPQNFNPFAQNQNQGYQIGNGSFPFGNAGHFMGGQQPPQVHFIAKKQQFIAQISPEQLMNGDKRPYTAQSLHNLSANAKRAGSVYANAMANTTKNQGSYNLANAAFTNQQVYLNPASKTHTQGFNFHPGSQGMSKYGRSDDVQPKIAGKDILHALGSSNGFNSGYNSDPYNSVMSQGLPASLTHSTRPVKTKASQNRLQTKEKEQLYDETIKMKVLNNQIKEDNVKLKTKVKILENELGRKEKTIEDLFSHNQLIQQSHSKNQSNSNQNLLPLAQTAQKYQQETFLVMSLKKQIRELKYEVVKRDEELEVLRKNIKNTRTKEIEQEVQSYHEECLRLRSVMEELIKQGAQHPIHHQTYIERANQMQGELNHKDAVIQQLTDQISQHKKFEKIYASGHSSTAQVINQNTSLGPNKAQESQHFESSPSDIQANHQGRDKSVERKHALAPGPQNKEVSKELQRARKQLREKEKEIIKLKSENGQIKRESQEKIRNDNQQSKDTESQVKTLKDKLKDQKTEVRRKDEKLSEAITLNRKLEEQLKNHQENLKSQEDQNKQLKAQLRTAKHNNSSQKQKQEKEKQDVKEVKETAKIEKTEKSVIEKPKAPKSEIGLVTLVAQREKLCRDDITAMMLAGEESLRMLIREPSDALIDFIKSNLDDEDVILRAIPRFEMPKTDFETQVLREMRVVLRENAEKINNHQKEELMRWNEFEEMYNKLDNFEYPHKDKLLEFIKYFFLDHIVSEDRILINFQAFKDHLMARRAGPTSAEKGRNDNSSLRSRRKSTDSSGSYSEDTLKKRLNGAADDDKYLEEERMLDVAEQCFMRIADLLHLQQKTVKQCFMKYSQPEQFKDGSVLELLSPRSFLEGVRDIGFDDVTEMEAACLMKVLSKPELENAVILNEFVLIMENFGIPPITEEEELENDYTPDTDDEAKEEPQTEEEKKAQEEAKAKEEESKKGLAELNEKLKKFGESKKGKNPLVIKFDTLDEKGTKILKKLARFLLERYMHPREFFGPTIKKEVFGQKKCKVEVIKLHDFYLRIKLASIRKKLKENLTLNKFLAIDGDKFPGFVQVKRMIKALEVIAEGEQELMLKEQEAKEKEELKKAQEEFEERKEKGLPEMSIQEILEKRLAERDEKEEQEKNKGKKKEEEEKDGKAKPPGGLDEVLKLAGKGKGKEKALTSLKGPDYQLNTIEEDLHETQTSHYSYQLKEGDGSDRDGSRHHLSTSNHLRNSNQLNEIDDSARNSQNRGPVVGSSVHSGDYSGGSNSGSKKAKDIDDRDISIKNFNELERGKSDMNTRSERLHPGHDSLRNNSIKEEQNEDEELKNQEVKGTRTQQVKKKEKIENIDLAPIQSEEDPYESQFEKTGKSSKNTMSGRSPKKGLLEAFNEKDALDEEVDKKFQTHIESSNKQNIMEEDYEDDDDFVPEHDLKQDTIKTDKIEQMVDELQNDQLNQEAVQGAEEIEEYSYHDESSRNSPKQQQPVKNSEVKEEESDIDEDYEF